MFLPVSTQNPDDTHRITSLLNRIANPPWFSKSTSRLLVTADIASGATTSGLNNIGGNAANQAVPALSKMAYNNMRERLN